MSAHSAVRLVIRWTESSIRVAYVRHFHIIVALGDLRIFRNGRYCGTGYRRRRVTSFTTFPGSVGCSDCWNLWCFLFFCWHHCRSLYESSFNSQSSIGKILSAVVSNLLVPYPACSFALKPGNDRSSFCRCVYSNTPILVVYLQS